MTALRAAWPNEARQHERIKTTDERYELFKYWLKHFGTYTTAKELRAIYRLIFHGAPPRTAVTPPVQSSVALHRPKRKQTVEFKGNSHPERKSKYSRGRKFPAHVQQKFRDADMWYTSDDYRRFETDLISLQFVTSYRDGVKNARKGKIVPRRQFKYSKSSSTRQAAEDKRWQLHVQRSNKERATHSCL